MTALVLQGRIDSSRLAGKSLLPLGGKPLILRVMEALGELPWKLRVLACPEDCVRDFGPLAEQAGFELAPGPKEDVLSRYCSAIRRFGMDRLVRATGDNPFVFADAAWALNQEAAGLEADYAAYTGLPYGAGVESVSAQALLRAEREAASLPEREHVCPYLYNHPELFRLHRPLAPLPWQGPALRLTVDTPEDYERAGPLYEALAKIRNNGERRQGAFIIAAYQKLFSHAPEPASSKAAAPDSAGPQQNAVKRPVLVVPSFEKGRGGGHLLRSMVLVRDIRSKGREAYLHIPGCEGRTLKGGPGELAGDFDESWFIPSKEDAEKRSWDFIVLDRFKTPKEEFKSWSSLAPVIGIDEGGALREDFDFLIDLLPGRDGISPPNMKDPSLLPLPENRRPSFFSSGTGPLKALVSFGAEDSAGLTALVIRALTSSRKETDLELTAVLVSRRRDWEDFHDIPGLKVLNGVRELREHLAEYELLITHFGVTVFEALYARLPVLLLSPGAYHEKLAQGASLFSAGVGGKGARRLKELLCRWNPGEDIKVNREFLKNLAEDCKKAALSFGLDTPPARSLRDLVKTFSPNFSRSCPVCGVFSEPPGNGAGGRFFGKAQNGTAHSLLARFPDRTYRRCPRCGAVYMFRPSKPPLEYAGDYFFGLYKKQYGKTYLEDFPNLLAAGKTRLSRIKAHLSQGEEKGRTLLDIGCAYGPFLAAAGEAGFSPVGLDPAQEAVAYVRETLKFPAFRGSFPGAVPGELLLEEGFDVITLWYVIEHFEEPGRVLKEIFRLLKPGGVLAFSTPSFSGISGRSSKMDFLEKSPPDHWSLWTPRYCGPLLKKFGFDLKKIVITGHHPERFPLVGTFLTGKKGPVYRLFFNISRLFRLGDTFEVYAVKGGTVENKKEPPYG
jgi:spore coat polysaccharide biosynthesis protein SpsF (cytidylyltransferase family)/SAM-dependent methyltransferase/spore coat polysaccharide biosynthesis predicted glycosyltransferase SpsG